MADAAVPPSGTITLLFTDIEGSTRMLLALGERYADALADHRRILRDVWSECGGTEMDTQGDSFFVVFPRASDALAAATKGQRLLAAHPWPGETPLRVRMGIHTGEPALSGGDYVGIDVHRAARIAAAGHGGQVLVSQTSKDLLPVDLPDGVRLRDLGMHWLKDLAEEEHLYQSEIPGLPVDFPALKSAAARRTNLPTPAAPLVGRAHELAEGLAILAQDDVRLLTLTGPGGMGKTRLALELGAEASAGYPDGVFIVNLEPIVDPSLVIPAVIQSLPSQERPTEPLEEWLCGWLADRRMLIILDNFEHLVASAPAIADLLGRTTGPKFIVTSREALHLSAEREYPVPPLSLPQSHSSDPAALQGNASVAFFLDRAHAVRPDFQLTHGNAAAVADICTRLDGLPLAIELAAPWLRMLEPRDLLERLGERLDLLADSVRDLPERQRTLRGAIDWSYRLLDEAEQTLLCSLGIFAGGWTLAAAEAICGTGAGTPVLMGLGSLINKNLVRRAPGPGDEARFEMLESIRRFALERLDEGGGRDALAARHARFFLELAERAEPELFGPLQAASMERLSADLDNVRAALAWAGDAPEGAEIGLRLSGALMLFWFFLGLYREGLGHAERLLGIGADASSFARANALLGAGVLATLIGDSARAEGWLTDSLALARELDDQMLVARCLNWLGLLTFFGGDIDGARASLEESAVNAREAGDLWCLADALGTLGSILPLQGAFGAAESASGEALQIAATAGDEQGTRMALFGLALSAARAGALAHARATAEEGLAISRSLRDPWFVSYFQWLVALTAIETGELEVARRRAEEAVDIARQLEAPLLLVCALDALGTTARAEQNPEAADACFAEAQRAAQGGGVPMSYRSSVMRGRGELAAARGDTGGARELLDTSLKMARDVGDDWAAARTLVSLAALMRPTDLPAAAALLAEALALHAHLGDTIGVAEALEESASMAAAAGEPRRAAVLIGAADELRTSNGSVRPAWLRPRREETVRIAQAGLGDEGCAAAMAQGRAETWERALDIALAGM